LLLGVDELADVNGGPDLVVRLQARHLGVDEVRPQVAGEGDAVVPVLDEVRAAELEDLDRRDLAVLERRAQAGDARPRDPPARPEVPVEVGTAVDRPDDPLDGDLAQAQVRPADDSQPPARLLEGEQVHARDAPTARKPLSAAAR